MPTAADGCPAASPRAQPFRPEPAGKTELLQSKLMSVQIAAREAAAAAPVPAASASPAAELELSVLVPVLDEAATVEELAERVAAVVTALGPSFEILFVDDGSRDGTADRVRAAHARDPRVKLLRLRRNFGKAATLSAGGEHARGPLILSMDGALQDAPAQSPRPLEALAAGPLDPRSGSD